jgi:hypothetical protein
MECLRIKVRAIGPLYGSESCVEFHAVEHLQILKRPKHLTFEHIDRKENFVIAIRQPDGTLLQVSPIAAPRRPEQDWENFHQVRRSL